MHIKAELNCLNFVGRGDGSAVPSPFRCDAFLPER